MLLRDKTKALIAMDKSELDQMEAMNDLLSVKYESDKTITDPPSERFQDANERRCRALNILDRISTKFARERQKTPTKRT